MYKHKEPLSSILSRRERKEHPLTIHFEGRIMEAILFFMARRRHLSRIAVMQVLFERERRPGVDFADALKRNAEELGEMDMPFAEILLLGTLEKEEELRAAVSHSAPEWTLDRMDPISRCVLLAGAFELLFSRDAPPAVVINEAIDIAKEYGSTESGKFVNGVLNAIAHNHKSKV